MLIVVDLLAILFLLALCGVSIAYIFEVMRQKGNIKAEREKSGVQEKADTK
jgi:hypothetical protein